MLEQRLQKPRTEGNAEPVKWMLLTFLDVV
jgi:hypothetical protein